MVKLRELRTLVLAVTMLTLGGLSAGCGMVSKQAKVKCPKCGQVFTIDEGLYEDAGG